MRHFIKHWGVVVIWIVLGVLALGTLPNTDKFSTGGNLPKSYSSTKAADISNSWSKGAKYQKSITAVFSNGNKKLTRQQRVAIKATINHLKKNKHRYQIVEITDAGSSKIARSQLISKDKTTQIAQLTLETKRSSSQISHQLTQGIHTKNVRTYVTGSDLLDDSFADSTEKGVQKTEIIAVIFIFLVLLLVFKSPVTPLISLATVGIAGVISLNIVFNLVKWFGFPFSSFTQVFIIIVLFGIGTDYNILLYNEFRDYLTQGLSKEVAIKKVMGNGKRTVMFSGISVLIGMSTLFLAKFYLYRSAAGIAIGIAVLLLVLLTVTPVLMQLIGKGLFWPMHKSKGEGASRSWLWLSNHAWTKPALMGGLVVIILLPLLLMGQGQLNYNDANEVSDTVPAKQGFNLVQRHFSKGMSEPTTLYIRSQSRLDNEKGLAAIDQLTTRLQTMPGVKTVMSGSQPGGSKIKALYVNQQLVDVIQGLKQIQQGSKKINKGIGRIQSNIKDAQITSGIKASQKLSQGSNSVASGNSELAQAVSQLSSGIQSTASTVSGFTQQLQQLDSPQIIAATTQLQGTMQQLNQGSQTLNTESQRLKEGSLTVAQGNQLMAQQLKEMSRKVEGLDQGLSTIKAAITNQSEGERTVTRYLTGLKTSSAAKMLYVPTKQVRGSAFKSVLDSYYSGDRRGTQMTIIFNSDPNLAKTQKQLGKIETMVNSSLRGTSLEKSEVAFDGITSSNKDLNDLATKDFKRTAILMLAGILIALIFVTRSLAQSIVIEGILLGVYYAALNLVHVLSDWLLGESQLTWNTPFFAFIMLIALGVDYSIFLMMKYHSLKKTELKIKERLLRATTVIGSTVNSAGIILAGTFAAMIPSGVITLIQVAMVVILGIAMLVLVIPVVMAIIIRLQVKAQQG